MSIRIVFEMDVAERFGEDLAEDAEDGIWCPRVYCDECGEPIHDGTAGRIQYRVDPAADQGLARFTHERCTGPFREDREGTWRDYELSRFPVHLANALQPDAKLVYDVAPRAVSLEPELVGHPEEAGEPRE